MQCSVIFQLALHICCFLRTRPGTKTRSIFFLAIIFLGCLLRIKCCSTISQLTPEVRMSSNCGLRTPAHPSLIPGPAPFSVSMAHSSANIRRVPFSLRLIGERQSCDLRLRLRACLSVLRTRRRARLSLPSSPSLSFFFNRKHPADF